MLLLVNGDSHAAAAEAVNSYAFANDDPSMVLKGRAPHPDNLKVSWGYQLSIPFKVKVICLAESASSNSRILRTTKEFINTYPGNEELLIIIGWSTWEREEWLIDDVYYQVNASGVDDIPKSHQLKYKEFVASVNSRKQTVTNDSHAKIWEFHTELKKKNIKHVFFNSNNDFSRIKNENQKDWGINYIMPYEPNGTYHNWLIAQGFSTISANNWHFDQTAHLAWSRYLLKYLLSNNLV